MHEESEKVEIQNEKITMDVSGRRVLREQFYIGLPFRRIGNIDRRKYAKVLGIMSIYRS